MKWTPSLNLIVVCGICILIPTLMSAQRIVGGKDKKTATRAAALTNPARALGQVTVVSGPTDCNGENCYELDIACSELRESNRLSVRAGNASAAVPARGTIIFLSGARGTNPWDGGAEPRRILTELRAAGFRTVVLQWLTAGGWSKAATGWFEGHGRLACRPATAARWVYDNLFTPTPTTAFCATGQSGGSSQVAYMIAQYGLADIISAAVLTGGPPHSRLDLGCLKYDSANQTAWHGDDGSAGLIDEGFGYTADLGPCTQSRWGFRKKFQEASIAFGDWQYNYPRTMVWFLLGAQENTASLGQYAFFRQRLIDAGSPFVRMDTVPNTGHGVPGTSEGANMIRDIMLNECRLR